MLLKPTNLGSITPIHTDFGNKSDDLLVVEYDVPQAKVKQTLFYKFGQLSIPKWALIPLGIFAFGLLTALCAIIVNSVLTQRTSTVTYSQLCSKTSKCKSDLGLTCGSQSKCVCSTNQYWYEDICVNQPTYKQKCNQTTECRTDLSLICAEIDGQCNCPNTTIAQTCDCLSTSYWTGSQCTPRSTYLDVCTVLNTNYQCLSNLYCNGSQCICQPNTQYWNYTANQCYSVDKYRDLCNTSTSYSCDASVSLYCLLDGEGSQCPFNVTVGTTSCDCVNGTYWNGGACVTKKTLNAPCFWNCECNTDAGLQCLNMSCVCPKATSWTSSSSCQTQKDYSQSSCYNTSECDTSKGLICYLSGATSCDCPITSTPNMCDCLPTYYYDYNLTSCQAARLYNETCYDNYMCDSSLGLFCQLNTSSDMNCSCPEPIRLNMCDCNMTSYWDGTACVSRLGANASCSFSYQCETNLTCIVNETDNGIFSDVCRCPLGSYFVNGSGCRSSQNYTQTCIGSYQCYELAPLSCRYTDTGLTCLDSSVNALPACDCSDNYYFDTNSSKCRQLLNKTSPCNRTCECNPPYECVSNQCQCPAFYSSLTQTCVDYLSYGDQCLNSTQCSLTPNTYMSCISGTCGCNSTGFWDGTRCQFSINFRGTCTTDANCYTGLVCQNISCISSTNKTCSCPSGSYYSSVRQSCTPCNGTDGDYTRYVINYPHSDICVAVYVPTASRTDSRTFTIADSDCNSLGSITYSNRSRLISVHNQTELNCLGTVLKSVSSSGTCNGNRYYYLGYTPTNLTFYDGTLYSSAFANPAASSTECLTYCYDSNSIGYLDFNACTGTAGGNRYGAICDYKVY